MIGFLVNKLSTCAGSLALDSRVNFKLSTVKSLLITKVVMGCCLCRPITSVSRDPTVTIRATVGDVFFDYGLYQSYNVGGCASGLMYVKEDSLVYECICCGRLCCLFCRCCGSCCGKSFDLDELTSVEVLENQSFSIRDRQSVLWINLNPGLRIKVKRPSGTEVTVLVQMQDAHEFAAQLSSRLSLKQ